MVKKINNSFEEDNSINIRGARQHNLKILIFHYPGINLLFLQGLVVVEKVH